MRSVISLLAGALFGLGLLVSDMVNTQKVQGWLDLFGAWDPTLAFVLGGGIIPMFFAWRLTKARAAPITGGTFPAPPNPRISQDLALGSVLFGVGWGLVGLCPGPAMASISFGGWSGALFMAAMLAGMAILPRLRRGPIGGLIRGS